MKYLTLGKLRELVNDKELDDKHDAFITIFNCEDGTRHDILELGCFDLTWLEENNFIDINID